MDPRKLSESTEMTADRDATLRTQIHEGMAVLAMDGDQLGHVFDIGGHALALERGSFLPQEWTADFSEVERVDERGVWLRNGRGSLQRVSDAFCGPTEAYRASAEASPIHQWSGFRPPAVAHDETQQTVPTDPSASSGGGRSESD